MISNRDLEGIDAAWLAMDELGQIAVFTTGGEGPVPATAIASIAIADDAIDSLPEQFSCELLATVPRPDDYIAFAKRGFFAYDWSDVHRTTRQSLGGYELQARPSESLLITHLPDDLRAVVAATKLAGVTFGALVVPKASVGT